MKGKAMTFKQWMENEMENYVSNKQSGNLDFCRMADFISITLDMDHHKDPVDDGTIDWSRDYDCSLHGEWYVYLHQHTYAEEGTYRGFEMAWKKFQEDKWKELRQQKDEAPCGNSGLRDLLN